MNPRIYLLVVNYHSSQWVDRLVGSLPSESDVSSHVIIVNNSPNDCEIDRFKSNGVTLLEAERNLGFGCGCNLGLEWLWSRDRTALVWLINPDTQLKDNTLDKIAAFFDNFPHLSIVGTIVEEAKGNIWFAGGSFDPDTGTISVNKQIDRAENRPFISCNWVSGCSTILNLNKFTTCPQFDRAFFLYYEDFDFCQRYASQGHSIAIVPHISIVHSPSSIADRHVILKFTESTYGYLLVLKRYATLSTFGWRLGRLFCHAIALLLLQPAVAIGKLKGMWKFLRFQTQNANLS